MSKVKIYLDDCRIPINPEWIHVSSYDEFINEIIKHDIENIEEISFDHDLGDLSITEYFNSVHENENPTFNYDNIQEEKTGMHCAKWFIDEYLLNEKNAEKLQSNYNIKINIHSANPVGKKNIQNYFESFYKMFGISGDITFYVYRHSFKKFD